ncbi:MAG: GAF domain-containing protein [Chloroflexi bacterium]|nr:GAF domain-containing protein [Chloroflexota bacterium]
MSRLGSWRVWLFPTTIAVITLVWFAAFPIGAPFDLSTLLAQVTFFLATWVACFVFARRGLDLLLAGSSIFALGRWLHVLDTLARAPNAWRVIVPSMFELVGLGVAVVAGMQWTARAATASSHARAAAQRREAILHAIRFSAEQFLKNLDWRQEIRPALARLGEATGVSRVYLRENLTDAQGALRCRALAEWVAPGIAPQKISAEYAYHAIGAARWLTLLQQNQPVVGNVRALPANECAFLELQGVRALVCMPIFVNDEWWGFLGFDECVSERDWTTTEIEALGMAASTLGAAIAREQIDGVLNERTRHLALLNDVTRAAIGAATMPELLHTLANRMGEMFRADSCHITLWDEATQRTIPAAAYGQWRDRFAALEPIPGETTLTASVLRAGHVLAIEDTANTPYISARIVSQFATRSALGLPLIAGDAKLGAVIVMFDAPRRFSPAEIARAEQAAAQLSLAIDKARLLEETRARAAQLSTLDEIGRAVSTLSNLEQVLETIYRQTCRVLPLDVFFICLYDSDSDTVSWPLMYDGGQRLPANDSRAPSTTMWQVILTRQGFRINRSAEELAMCDAQQHGGDAAHKSASMLFVPLAVGESVIGVMSAQSYQVNAYSDAHLTLLNGIGYQAAIAIANARLYDETHRRARDLVLLNEIGRAAMRAPTMRELMQMLADRVGELFHADHCHVTRWDAATQRAIPVAAYGRWRDSFATLDAIPGEVTITSSALSVGHALVIEDVSDTPYLSPRLLALFGMRSILGLPLIAGDEKLGALMLFYDTPRQFTSDEIARAEQAAAQLSLAVAKAKSVEQAHERLAHVSALHEIDLAITTMLSQTDRLQVLLEHTMRQMRADLCSVLLIDAPTQQLKTIAQRGARTESWRAITFQVGEGAAGWIVQHAQPLALLDVSADPRWLSDDASVNEGIVSYLGVPMRVENRVIGVLDMGMRTWREFSAEEIDFFVTLAGQAAVALENGRLFEQVEQRAREFAALYETTRDLATPRELPVLLNMIIERAVGLLNAHGGGELYLCDAERRAVHCLVSYHTPRDYTGVVLRYGEGAAGTVVMTGEPLVIDDYRVWSGRAATYEKDQPYTAVVCVPMIWQGKVIGALDLLDDVAQRRFTHDDARLLTLFANQAAAMIENARLFDEITHRADQMATLYHVGRTLNSTLETDAILDAVIDVAMRATGATHGCLCIVNRAANHFSYRALRGFDAELAQHTHANRLALDAGLNGRAYRTRQVVCVDDVCATADYVEFVSTTRAELIVPMIRGGNVIGTIDLQSPQVGAFHQADLDFLRALADHAGVALDHAQLFEEVQRRAREQTIINDITRALNRAMDVRAAFPAIVEGVHALVACDRVSLALLDDTRTHVTMFVLDQPHAELSEGTRFPISATAAADDVLAGRVHVTDDLNDEADYAGERVLRDAGYRSRVNMPLMIGDRAIGALNIMSRQIRNFDATHLPTLQQIANAIAIAIENTRLFEAEQARRAELGTLYNLSRTLAELNDAEAMMNVVTQRTVETIRVTFARIAFYENGFLTIRSANPLRLIGQDLRVGRRDALANLPVLHRVPNDGTPLLLHADDPTLTDLEREALLLDWARVVCVMPLRVGGRAFGCLMLGEARSEQREPFDDDKLRLARSIGDQTASALHRAELFTQIEGAYVQTVLALGQAIDVKDTYTANHAQRLAVLSLTIGREVGLSPRELEDLRFGAILHDVGKIGVPDAILQKSSELDGDEWQKMRQHPIIGEQILAPVPRLAGAARIVRHHHERFDGAGYPDGLAGEAIPIGARILTVVDAYSAITDRRVYKRARSHQLAVTELERHADTQFDPRIVEIFVRLFAHHPPDAT